MKGVIAMLSVLVVDLLPVVLLFKVNCLQSMLAKESETSLTFSRDMFHRFVLILRI